MNLNEPRPKRRLWPRTLAGKAGVAALAGLALLIGMYIVAGHYAAKRLEEAWALSDEFGLSNDIDALLGPNVAAEQNMAMPLDKAAERAISFVEVERSFWKGTGDPFDDPLKFAALDRFVSDAEYNAWLAEADARTEYHSPAQIKQPINQTLLPHLNQRQGLAIVERGVAQRLTNQGRREEAVRRLLLIVRLTRRWEDKEPFMVAALVNVAIRLIAIEGLNAVLRSGGPLPASMHDEIDREAAACETILRLILRMGQYEKIASVADYKTFSPLAVSPLLQPLIDNDRAYKLHYMHRWAKLWDKPLYEARAELEALDREIRGIAGDGVRRLMYMGSVMSVPAVMQMRMRMDRLIAESRCLRIVNAMARKGDFKEAIDSLGLPKECIIDPFDGKPMRVKPTDKGPIVYSIGQDFTDDGGSVGTTSVAGKDVGLGPPVEAAKQ